MHTHGQQSLFMTVKGETITPTSSQQSVNSHCENPQRPLAHYSLQEKHNESVICGMDGALAQAPGEYSPTERFCVKSSCVRLAQIDPVHVPRG